MVFTEPERLQETSGELSAREKEVLKELASGKTNKEIADHLSISVNTVITHRKNVSSKLGIKSVSGLSLYALMNGII
ncbi:MAG: response regulator transcription factor [Bacteroides sp.]|nr:response regulator transcription factor [Bacteroides sp.]